MTRLVPKKDGLDPRSQLGPEALAEAATNAFPMVARQSGKREGASLLLGVSIALLLGAGTLFSMSLSRSAKPQEPQPEATASGVPSQPAVTTVPQSALMATPPQMTPGMPLVEPTGAPTSAAMIPPALTA